MLRDDFGPGGIGLRLKPDDYYWNIALDGVKNQGSLRSLAPKRLGLLGIPLLQCTSVPFGFVAQNRETHCRTEKQNQFDNPTAPPSVDAVASASSRACG